MSKWSNEGQLLGPHPTGAADSSVVIFHVKSTSIQPITNDFTMELNSFFYTYMVQDHCLTITKIGKFTYMVQDHVPKIGRKKTMNLCTYMGGLVMMVISKKNWEFLPNSISTM